MKISQEGLSLLKQCEGFRSHVYLDVAGIPTIGYGHKLIRATDYPNGISEAQASVILECDVLEAEEDVTRLVKVPLTQGQFDALVDFTFNLGAGNLARSTLLKELNAGQYDRASAQLLLWDHTGAIEVEALKARRKAEFNLWHKG